MASATPLPLRMLPKALPAPVISSTRPEEARARTADSEISFQLMRLLPMIIATNTPISMDMVLLPRNATTEGTASGETRLQTVLSRSSTTGVRIGSMETNAPGALDSSSSRGGTKSLSFISPVSSSAGFQ